nr:glycerophosphodiester phosphodiesterase family protein [Haloglycomyces albus]
MSTPLIAAHRGSNEFLPEQTIAAFRQALEEDADGLEFDVRLTADRQLVLHHDRNVRRTSDGRGAIADLTLDELKKFDFSVNRDNVPDDPEARELATLEELFKLVSDSGKDVKLYAELKHPSRFGGELETRFFEFLRDWPELDVVVMSFSKAALKRWHELDPERGLVWIFEFPYGKIPPGVEMLSSKVDYIESAADFAATTKDDGYGLLSWTVNDPDQARRLADQGVDVLFSDRPGEIKKALALKG